MDNFSWVKNLSLFNKDFTQKCNAHRNGGYFLEVQYPEKLHEFHDDLLFLPKNIKIKKAEKPIAHLHDKKEYMIHIRNWKQPLNHGVIKFNQKAWLKSYIDTNRELKKMQKIIFWQTFFQVAE